MPKDSSVTGFVLVGGESRRMGQDKALLELGGRPLFLRAADLLLPHAREVVLLGSPARYSHFGLPVLEDQYPARGPLGGLWTGLKNSSCDWNVFLACDLPFLQEGIVEGLLRRVWITSAQAIIPITGNGWQPLCAAYHRSCLPAMQSAIERDDLAVVGLFPFLRVEALSADPSEDLSAWEGMFRNVNTVEEWEQVQRALEITT